jgi:hypothetical protein
MMVNNTQSHCVYGPSDWGQLFITDRAEYMCPSSHVQKETCLVVETVFSKFSYVKSRTVYTVHKISQSVRSLRWTVFILKEVRVPSRRLLRIQENQSIRTGVSGLMKHHINFLTSANIISGRPRVGLRTHINYYTITLPFPVRKNRASIPYSRKCQFSYNGNQHTLIWLVPAFKVACE